MSSARPEFMSWMPPPAFTNDLRDHTSCDIKSRVHLRFLARVSGEEERRALRKRASGSEPDKATPS
jgi:hypothetical protein